MIKTAMIKTGYVQSILAIAIAMTVLLASSQTGTAQLLPPLPIPSPSPTPAASTVAGAATALQATVLGATTSLASTGNLTDAADARGASAPTGSIASIGGAEVLHATTISSDAVRSEASLADLALIIAGVGVSADFALARAMDTASGAPMGQSSLGGLVINGSSFFPSGTENETLYIGGVKLVLNEVVQSAGGITVNALHLTSLDGLVDVVVASATAGVQ